MTLAIGAPTAFAQAEAVPVVDAPAPGATMGIEARRQALFAAMLADPENLDVAFEYALLSAQVGDYEAAIATLERMLIFAPNLPRVQLELGVLYYRIGATETAKSYLEAANTEAVPPVVRERVRTFLAQIDREERRLFISGSMSVGIQYQSNANFAPGDDVITVNGLPVLLDQNARSTADGLVFALASIYASWDLRNQGDLIEANLTTYNSVYFDLTRLNLNLVEVTLGPSFTLGRIGFDDARLGVYGIVGGALLDYELYSTTYGGGTALRATIFPDLLFDARVELRAINYSRSPNYPTARLQTGEELRTYAKLTKGFGPRILASLTGQTRHVFARTDFRSFDEGSLTARGIYYFRGPSGGILSDDAPWAASIAVGGILRGYDGPDPFIDPTETQEDAVLIAEAGIEVPFERGIAAFLTGQVRHQMSNYEIRDFTNAVLTAGVTKRF